MWICPNCHKEYIYKVDVCEKCSAPVELDSSQLILLMNANNINEATLVTDILKDHGIESLSNQPGSGEYLTILMGKSNAGINIYIFPHNIEEACQILADSFPQYEYLLEKDYGPINTQEEKVKELKRVLLFSIMVPVIFFAVIYFVFNRL